jgi:hypothetical protein
MGVPVETIVQMAEAKNFLARQFGLDLVLFPVGVIDSGKGGGSGDSRRHQSSPDEVTFSVQQEFVGGIIGKGGQGLKDLQGEFGVRLYVEKEKVSGMRLVVLKPLNNGPAGELERAAMHQCQQKIMMIVAQEQSRQAAAH